MRYLLFLMLCCVFSNNTKAQKNRDFFGANLIIIKTDASNPREAMNKFKNKLDTLGYKINEAEATANSLRTKYTPLDIFDFSVSAEIKEEAHVNIYLRGHCILNSFSDQHTFQARNKGTPTNARRLGWVELKRISEAYPRKMIYYDCE